jgi:hypothetical protein
MELRLTQLRNHFAIWRDKKFRSEIFTLNYIIVAHKPANQICLSVLFLSLMNSAAWGGSEEIWYKAALYLAKKDHQVGICCFNWPEKEEKLQQLTNAGCELFLLPGRNETTTLIGKFKLRKKLRAVPFKIMNGL